MVGFELCTLLFSSGHKITQFVIPLINPILKGASNGSLFRDLEVMTVAGHMTAAVFVT
jgi:hypothetical protein